MTDTNFWISLLINIGFLFFSLKLAISTNLIKDDSIQTKKPFSYAKSQLFWWTVIIISIFIWCAVYNKGVPQLTPFCLALLGISAGTTAAGALIDNSDKSTPSLVRHQDAEESRSFLRDILSDAQGNYSISRFQSFIFNLSIGIIYLWIFFNGDKKTFPSFTDEQTTYILGLLGISNIGYAGLKISENSTRKDQVAQLRNQGKPESEIRESLKPQ
jgi:hypothetical protein